MGKHSKRKAGYLPRVAAGAAPFALLLAAPAAAWAADLTQPLGTVPLPLDHQHEGTFGRDLQLGNDGNTSVVKGFLNTYDHDIYSRQLGDVKVVSDTRRALSGSSENRDSVAPGGALSSTTSAEDTEAAAQAQKHTAQLGNLATAVTGTEQHLDKSGSRSAAFSNDPLGVITEEDRRLGASDSGQHAVRLPEGVDVVSENAEQADGRLVRTLGVEQGRFAGVLGGHRSSGQALDLGDSAAVGMTSDQHALGRFTGTLVGADLGQSHAFGGHAGPATGLADSSQSSTLGSDVPNLRNGGELTDRFSGELGVDNVLDVQGRSTTSTSGTLPAGTLAHDQSASLQLMDQAPTTTGLKLGAPPLSIEPR
ncbi:hypothetical protein [Amycolatopsis sp. H20-H5]|uniref:hypothetical protein n=1 Tax=Amycolatopsis sp. H20-H5 TaxID=3046309 RepID=UPI002DBEED3B|nr:hypothetical protein [Amycolatopsis sp. H20-H5]MEC3975631.1 hypothetical protein [Amycolatopsis sp. H20-H5]